MLFLSNLNLSKNELQNAVLQPLATAPSNPKLGQVYYNSGDKLLYLYDGSAWTAAGAVISVAGKTGVVTLDKSDVGLGNVDNTSDATKKTNFTGSIADGNTGFVTGDDAYDALALKAPLASPALTGTPTAPTATTGDNSTKIATTAFVAAAIAAVGNTMVFKGTVNSASDLPDNHTAGWTYVVGTAGTYAGQTCEVGDTIYCITSGTTASNSDWAIVQTNINGAVTGPASSISGHIPTFNGTSGKVIQDGYGVATSISNDSTTIPTTAAVNTALSGKSTVSSATGTIGTSATSASVSYSGTLINAYALQGGEKIVVDIAVTASAVTFSVAAAPSSAITCYVIYA